MTEFLMLQELKLLVRKVSSFSEIVWKQILVLSLKSECNSLKTGSTWNREIQRRQGEWPNPSFNELERTDYYSNLE